MWKKSQDLIRIKQTSCFLCLFSDNSRSTHFLIKIFPFKIINNRKEIHSMYLKSIQIFQHL